MVRILQIYGMFDEHITAECNRSRGQTVQRLTGGTTGGVHHCGQGSLCNGCCFIFCLWMMDVDECSLCVSDGLVNCSNDAVTLGVMQHCWFGLDTGMAEELLE